MTSDIGNYLTVISLYFSAITSGFGSFYIHQFIFDTGFHWSLFMSLLFSTGVGSIVLVYAFSAEYWKQKAEED